MADNKTDKIGVTATAAPRDSLEDISLATNNSSNGKTNATATTTAVPHEQDALMADESVHRTPDRNLKAAIWTIVCGVALPCIPVIVVSAVLLGFIFQYRIVTATGYLDLHRPVITTGTASRNFTTWVRDTRHVGGKHAYYVNYNASTLTTIASWTGRVIPYLSSSIMTLVAFFAARRLVVRSKRGTGDDLPSPENITLLIDLLSGRSFEPLKDTLVHRLGYKRKLTDPIPLAFSALLTVTLLAILIPLVDTWFGVSTTAATVTQLYNATWSPSSFGHALTNACREKGIGSYSAFEDLIWVPCNLVYHEYDGGLDSSLVGSDEATHVSIGISPLSEVANYTADSGVTYYYMADKRTDATIDFKADTFAISTECKPITRQCFPIGPSFEEGYNMNVFNCSPGFFGNMTFDGKAWCQDDISINNGGGGCGQGSNNPSFGLAFSTDAALTHRVGAYNTARDNSPVNLTHWYDPDWSGTVTSSADVALNESYQYFLLRNPLHFATWATGYPTYNLDGADNMGVISNPLLNDTQIYGWGNFARYTWVNGSIYTFDATPASKEMGGLISAPFALRFGEATNAMSSAVNIAGTSNTSTDLANTFASGWSKAALAMSAGVLEPSANIIEQYRNSTIAVARMPMIPLYLLLGVKLLYVLAVVLLAVGAYCFTHPAETEVVKTQLSAKGLAAAHFDSPDMLQQNVVQQLNYHLRGQQQGASGPGGTAGSAVDEKGVKRAATAPAGSSVLQEPEKKVGLVAQADGAWRFAVVANGVWQGIKPIAVSLIDMEAKQGNLGAAGGVVNAWAR